MSIRNNITVSTTETEVVFDARYHYIWVRNLGATDCYASIAAEFDASDADVAYVKAGESVRLAIPDAIDARSVFIKTTTGTTTADIYAQIEADCPFGV